MEKIRISEVAKECAKTPKEALEKALQMGLNVKSVSSSVTQEEAGLLYQFLTTGENPIPPKEEKEPKAPKKTTKTKESKDTKEKAPKKTTAKKSTKIQETQDGAQEAESLSAQNTAPQNEIQTQETTESKMPMPKKGLRIVRKNEQEEKPATTQKSKTSHVLSARELFAQTQDEEYSRAKPKKATIKPKTAPKHTSQQKMDILEDREFNFERDYDDEQDEIVLFDLNEQEMRDEEEENRIKQAITERVQVHRKSPWMSEGSIKRGGRSKKKYAPKESAKELKSVIAIPEEVRVYEFADLSGRELKDVIKVLFNLGVMATKNDFLDKDSIEILAEEFKIQVEIVEDKSELEEIYKEQDKEFAPKERPAVITIMGHVDHGKTSLLDYIRNSRIAAKESGGITQHIGAYMVEKNGKMMSFIDTPGHEAFTSMRSRGAQVTDIAIIVIAADDGVKPQTIEALNHAKAANVQIIIAMNKMDKENANPDKLKAECAELGFTPNEWGGEYEFIPISAKTGEGVDSLLETILIQAELLELKAPSEGKAKAVVLEGSLEKGRGPVATIIVQSGTLKIGDSVVAGTAFGRIRAMSDDMGKNINALTPSFVAQIVGLSEVPDAGSALIAVDSDTQAREFAQKRALYLRQKELSKSTKVTFEELGDMVAQGNLKTLPLIIKADTQGSLEAIKSSLEKLSNDEVRVNIISFGVGGVSESDIDLCATKQNCLILGFNIRPTGSVKAKAKELGVEIKTYSIIYALLDEIKGLLSGLMSPVIEEENTGQAQVRETFSIPKVGVVAGCMVVEGTIQRGIKVRLIRDGVVVHTGQITSLKRFKDDAKEVSKGYECGIMLENFNDIKVGDVFETFREIHTQAKI
ncbi:translation initiation factor IF-2 [Helicobacter sp. MIT 00-7814]|uniref:translation initiation factor IF-2 n=1 Tax=unclassified Helicobacter TaxID=2593540 RepID=UPI000E1EAB6E|nr:MULTISPECIES: translation initiation factor IF-2 [unclassified Helicobacter]RDU57182.1 translation initiation factor IF-2 [Helicobacter sp. MIT 00-7814]RDU57734.1 translation initiation factor IF-2 [Helicobacter sp. MIT 99-10781]